MPKATTSSLSTFKSTIGFSERFHQSFVDKVSIFENGDLIGSFCLLHPNAISVSKQRVIFIYISSHCIKK